MNKRVFVCGLAQESNSFNPVTMGIESFSIQSMERCAFDQAMGSKEYLINNDVECVYGVSMLAPSGAHISDSVVEYFLNDTLSKIKDAGKLDGILFVFHGATMSENCDDVCGYFCEEVRRAVGDDVIMSASFDLHANITEKITENLDYICGYWEYPHIDRYQTGVRAAKMLCERLSGKQIKTARAAVPMMAPASAYTTVRGALKKLNQKAQGMIADGRIADYSVFQVQPWLDNPLSESAVIVIAEEEQTAISVANELANDNFNNREELQGEPLLTVAEVIEKALNNKTGKPIVLADSADSIGAGSTGDSASLVEALLPYADRLKAATEVRDVPAVKKAMEVGIGNTAEFTIGASISSKLSAPVKVKAKVRSLHDGNFRLYGPVNKGAMASSGKTAVLEIGKLLVRVSETARNARDMNYYNSFGITVEDCDFVAVKACTSFRAGYEHIAAEICNANTSGAASPTLLELPYERLPKKMYPFEEITESDIKPAKCYR